MRYMLTIQHNQQKVAYIEFEAGNDNAAIETGESILKRYKAAPAFMPRMPYESGNFTGYKPSIKTHYLSKWVDNVNVCNAWGVPCGGYWSTIKEKE